MMNPLATPATPTSRSFGSMLEAAGLPPLHAAAVTTMQVNMGKLCNQACKHCHVDAGPHQTGPEVNMGAEMVGEVVRVLGLGGFELLDLTGGAPELNPHFRGLVLRARALGVRVMDRCNLSVLFEPGQEDLGGFLARNGVAVTASLPFYHRDRTDRQRGIGVFDKSIEGLRLLNGLGYGRGGSLELNLVYNPSGAYLPPEQEALELDFKQELDHLFGITFDRLFCITNMPIARYLEWLCRSGNLESYMQALLDAFNPATVPGLMCRTMVSVAPDGTLHDCDFNQMLDIPLVAGVPRHIGDFDRDALARRPIAVATHCLGCTAGAGSSCGGSTA